MIISHKHRFIFIKTQKTAGTSLEIALSRICGPKDVLTPISPKDEAYRRSLGYRGKQNYFFPANKYLSKNFLHSVFLKRRATFYNHMSAAEIKSYIAPEVWDNYFKFCFERDPFDKFVSWYYWSGGKKNYPTMKDFIDSGAASRILGFDLYTIDAIPVVDKVYKFEQLPAALRDLSQRFQLKEPLQMPEKKAKGTRRKNKAHYSDILSDYEIEWISRIFAREIKYFDYKFHVPGTIDRKEIRR